MMGVEDLKFLNIEVIVARYPEIASGVMIALRVSFRYP